MAFWEFLIQKEGDRSWLPLESSTVEILEGRYRIVARSSRSNTGVEIRVTHNATTETPPIRRIQKRTSQTNPDGLLVIMPYTRLSPGTWELRCTGDLMTDIMGKSWQYAIQLDVQPIEIDHSDWEEDWQEEQLLADQRLVQPPFTESSPESSPESGKPHSVEAGQAQSEGQAPANLLASENSHESLGEIQPEAAIAALIAPPISPTAADLGEALEIKYSADSTFAADQAADGLADRSPQSLRLQLKESNYIVQSGQPLVLIGAIELGDGSADQTLATLTGKLRVRLFNPQTSQMLVDETQPLLNQSLPFPISLPIALPANCETHLILGELALYGQSGGQSGETSAEALPPVLATQSFSVTTDLLELLNAIANKSEVAEPPASSSSSDENKAFLDLRPPIVPALQFRPVIQQPLPPQLHPVDPNKSPRSLDLPDFPKHSEAADSEVSPDSQAEANKAAAQQSDIPTDIHTDIHTELADLSKQAASEQPVSEPLLSSQPTAEAPPAPEWRELSPDLQPQLELISDTADPAIDWQNSGDHLPYWQQKSEPDAPPSSKAEDVAFRSLNLQERFLSKLQSLAGDVELAEWISDQEPIESSALALRSNGESISAAQRQSSRSTDLDAELTAHEIVVEAPEPRSSHSTELSRIQALAATTNEPIAAPELEVPNGELAAGQTIPVTVRLPGSYARIYAKLWMHDRQSRALLDGPHWLMDFTPDGFGNQVVKSQIMVPFGCLEVQFEAIAIDMTNQRESDKVSVVRTVIPPSLTALSIEELEG